MTTEERKAWVASLKVGDRVIVTGSNMETIETVESIARGCPTVRETKYNRTGDCIGSGFGFGSIEPWDEARAAEIDKLVRVGRMRSQVQGINTYRLTTDQLARICAILDEPKIECHEIPEKEGRPWRAG